jgi:hypothetical protein
MAEMTMPCLYGRVTKSNALNTLLAYITRQSTLNKLMESGINVFADAAGTTLRPALDILSDVVERWQDNAEAMPMTLVEIADEMGVMSEEMSEIIGLTDEWTQMQKLELEQINSRCKKKELPYCSYEKLCHGTRSCCEHARFRELFNGTKCKDNGNSGKKI